MVFAKIRDFFSKKKKFAEQNVQNYQSLRDQWDKFIEKDTYLISIEKERLLTDLRDYIKIPWYIRLFCKIKLDKESISELRQQFKVFNEVFIQRRLNEFSSFFEGKDDGLKYPLNPEQRLAVIKDDKHNLVIAGAGSGKTSVIASRIAYITRRKDKVEKNRILALAFNRDAVKEMQERLENDYEIEIKFSTFHSLGRRIIYKETGKKPELLFEGSESKQSELVVNIFLEILKENEYQDIFINYIAYYLDQEVEKESFEDKELYYKYMRNKRYLSLNDIPVKSISERNIANFFFTNNIDFQYELRADWVDHERGDSREYHPDFYLPDYDIYIEHWGVNENLEVPDWFTETSEGYLEKRDWKLSQFEKFGKTLVDTWEYERHRDTLIPNLKENLLQINPNIDFIPMTYEELIEKTDQCKEHRSQVSKLMLSFIQIAKSNFLRPDDISERLKTGNYNKREKLFGEIALEVYRRYEAYLEKEDKIDFNDMINDAVDLAKKNPERYNNMLDHILVDEFQDISYQRLELIRAFVNEHSDTKLFCVGDDWQSIYAFTGSDVRYFTDFAEYFPHPEITHLTYNYRSSQKIVELSNKLIANNKNQIQKTVRSFNDVGQSPILYELANKFSFSYKMRNPNVYNLIKILLSEGIEPKDIMVLSRFNNSLKDLEILCGANNIPTEVKAGGIRFQSAHSAKGTESEHVILIDVLSGLYGFPCEIQDSSVMSLAKRFPSKSYIEEERRLFYVATTRSKQYLYIFTVEDSRSMFLNEIDPFLSRIHIDTGLMWTDVLPDQVSSYLNNEEMSYVNICPECGRRLVERSGRYGRFMGCLGYPTCEYTVDLEMDDQSKICPDCGKRLVERKGSYGAFLGCLGFPNCTYKEQIEPKKKIFISVDDLKPKKREFLWD